MRWCAFHRQYLLIAWIRSHRSGIHLKSTNYVFISNFLIHSRLFLEFHDRDEGFGRQNNVFESKGLDAVSMEWKNFIKVGITGGEIGLSWGQWEIPVGCGWPCYSLKNLSRMMTPIFHHFQFDYFCCCRRSIDNELFPLLTELFLAISTANI